MRYLLAFLLIFTAQIIFASQVLVIVDGKAITTVDLKRRVDALKEMYPDFMDNTDARKQIIQNLISEELFHNEATRLKVVISKEEVEERLKEMQNELHYSDAQVKRFLENKSIYQQVESQLLWSKLVSAVFYNKIKVSEAEIRDEQKVRSEQVSAVDFKQLLFQEFETEKVNKMIKEVKSCNNFDTLAQSYRLPRPYHNSLPYQDLNPDLQAIIKSLPVNKPSDIFNLGDYSQVIVICDKKITHKLVDPKIIKQELTARKINAEAQKYLSELKKRIYVEYVNAVE